jgi:hypothetical protein
VVWALARDTPPLSICVHELLYFFQHASHNAASLVRGSQGTYPGMHLPRSLLCGTLRPYYGNQCVQGMDYCYGRGGRLEASSNSCL